MRTPDELRLSQIADFFDVTVEFLRRDNIPPAEREARNAAYANPYANYQTPSAAQSMLREADALPYGLPSLRREDSLSPGSHLAELAIASARLMGMIGTTTKSATEGRFDIGKSIIVLRRLGDLLEHKLREADPAPSQSF